MKSYNQSTIGVIGDIKNGLFVETGIQGFAALAAANYTAFTVIGRVLIHCMFFEVTTLWVNATTIKFTYAMTVPAVVAAADLSAVSGSLDTFVAGRRLYCVGTLTSTTPIALPAAPGISTNIVMASPMMLGMAPSAAGVLSVGQLGFTTATSPATASAGKMCVYYTAVDVGASITAVI